MPWRGNPEAIPFWWIFYKAKPRDIFVRGLEQFHDLLRFSTTTEGGAAIVLRRAAFVVRGRGVLPPSREFQ